VKRLFRLQWQDVSACAEAAKTRTEGISKVIFEDVALYLKKRGYGYFDGFRQHEHLPILGGLGGTFSLHKPSLSFLGFRAIEPLEFIAEPKRLFNQ